MTLGASSGSYDVRVWAINTYKGARRSTYTVRWQAGAARHQRTFPTRKLAESFRSKLLTAANQGEPFDPRSGLPLSLVESKAQVSWYEHACGFIDLKWTYISPRHRKSIAEALVGLTVVLVDTDSNRPPTEALRNALLSWSFNYAAREGQPVTSAEPPEQHATALRWIGRRSIPVDALSDPVVLRRPWKPCPSRGTAGGQHRPQ